MILSDKLILEKGLDELRKVDKFTIEVGCNGFSDLVKQYFTDNKNEYETNLIHTIEDKVDLCWGDIYTYEIIKLTDDIKQERRKKFIDEAKLKFEREFGVKIKVEKYDTL